MRQRLKMPQTVQKILSRKIPVSRPKVKKTDSQRDNGTAWRNRMKKRHEREMQKKEHNKKTVSMLKKRSQKSRNR